MGRGGRGGAGEDDPDDGAQSLQVRVAGGALTAPQERLHLRTADAATRRWEPRRRRG